MWERRHYRGGTWKAVVDAPPSVYRRYNAAVKRGRRDELYIPCRMYVYRYRFCV